MNRRFTAVVTILAIALSVTLLLGVERLRTQAKRSFTNSISGVDLIVGPRTGAVQLLLYAVFHIGSPTNDLTWETYETIAKHPDVAWTVPISLGDSHRGFPIVGTSRAYFERYRFAGSRKLGFARGRPFEDVFDAVIGADVARELGYVLGDEIVVAHGLGELELMKHDNKPFKITGILKKTGTPVDRTVHLSLEGIEGMHVDWMTGAPIPGVSFSADQVREMDLHPKAVSAILVGLRTKFKTLVGQRYWNDYRDEALLAILPVATLQSLWDTMAVAENALMAISAFVVVTGLVGMVTVILGGLNERRREMAILRSAGARPGHIFALLVGEAGLFAFAGAALGMVLVHVLAFVAQPLIQSRYGMYLPVTPPTRYDLSLFGAVVACGIVVGFLPAWRAYRMSLADGMTIRL